MEFFPFWSLRYVCRGPDSNRHECYHPRDFKSLVSANSTTPALWGCKSLFADRLPTYVEAASGFEPLHKGFADLSLTTWVRRLILFNHLLLSKI
jgi:hypothetical protein